MKKLLSLLLLKLIIGFAFASIANGFQLSRPVKQTPEVIEAYNVCRRFQQLIGENLDFARAYEATFTKNTVRRRKIAIVDGEFKNKDFSKISNDLLIDAYKQRMQIFYLMLVLAGADKGQSSNDSLEIEKIVKREPPLDTQNFPDYVSQLKRDADFLRSHLDILISQNPSFANSLRKFKAEILSEKLEPPTNYKVAPSNGYYSERMLRKDERFYEIKGYILTKEKGKMRIVGIKFFNRLF